MADYVTHDEYAGREKLCDERFARDKHQIEEHEDMLRKLSGCNIRLTEMMERHDAELKDHGKRLTVIEHKPADTWGKLKVAFLTAIISGVAGYVVSTVVAVTK